MIREWRNLPQVRHYMLTDHVISADEHHAWFERVFESPTCRYWVIRSDDQDVGLLYLYDIDEEHRSCYWGFYRGDDTHGRNVGMFAEYFALQFAFQELMLEKVLCETLDFNRGVLRLHQSFGFVEDEQRRGHIRRDDGAHDVICMEISREVWESKQPEFEGIFRRRGLL